MHQKTDNNINPESNAGSFFLRNLNLNPNWFGADVQNKHCKTYGFFVCVSRLK